MRRTDYKIKIITAAWLLAMVLSILPRHAHATAQMSDYCVTPPYIGSAIEPNLLLMIDNSASMYDLTYTDTSHTYCANAPTNSCTTNSYCAGLSSSQYPAYCLQTTQQAPCNNNADCSSLTTGDICVGSGTNKYCQLTTTPVPCTNDSPCTAAGDYCNNRCSVTHSCYDNTYSDSKFCSVSGASCTSNLNCTSGETCAGKYPGYFDRNTNYSYDFSTNPGKFTASSMPASCSYSAGSPLYVCVNVNSTPNVTSFVASGNFLNWLTMSKFDIEKQVLTGGKYDGSSLLAETRGCSGRKFIKTVMAGNMSGLTFAVRGGTPTGIQNITSQSTEYGQTWIEVYQGTYNAAACVAAMNDWMNVTSTNLGPLQVDTSDCIGGSQNNPVLSTANQAIHDCFWYFNGHGLTNLQPIKNSCVQDWNGGRTMSSIVQDDPDAICGNNITHSPSLVDGNTVGYLGLCYNTTVIGGWDDACALRENKDFCQALGNASQVPDPQTSTIVKPTVQNVPGFVTELGLASLAHAGSLAVKVDLAAPPSGIIDKYKGSIRFGVMKFQNNGSKTECNQQGYCSNSGTTSCTYGDNSPCGASGKCIAYIPCASVCSNEVTRQCFRNEDCTITTSSGTSTGTCEALTDNADGGFISSYIGPGHCSLTTTQACTFDGDCPSALTPSSETCVAEVGNHTSGLIKSIDDIPATSWTPFAEAFYNAMGYLSRMSPYPVPPNTDSTATPPTSRNFNFSDTPSSFLYSTSMNPSQRKCQKNNVLILTDGVSTADRNSEVNGTTGFATMYAPLVSSNTSSANYGLQCSYAGSASLPVLTWVANHRNIKNPNLTGPLVNGDVQKVCSNDVTQACASDSECGGDVCSNVPRWSSESINTYVVYTGSTTTSSNLCDPLPLVTKAATNGGTQLFQASGQAQLEKTLANAFDQVAAKASSGTAASVLATGQGSGANLIQAVFYPHKKFSNSALGQNGSDEISWISRLTNLWYYVDPFANFSTIREDNGTTGTSNPAPWAGDKILHTQSTGATSGDYIVQMYYDSLANDTKAKRVTDPAGTGVISLSTPTLPTISFEDLGYLWEAGTQLWRRNLTTSPRNIKTTIDETTLIDFSTAHAGDLAPFMNTSDTANIISWVTGSDVSSAYRSRTVKIESIDTTPRVWKLGDVINSTPKIMAWKELNSYFERYGDTTYGVAGNLSDLPNPSQFTTTSDYKLRGMVFAGANDGMLHAFKLGKLQLSWSGQGTYDKARLVDPDTGNVCNTNPANPTCGQEVWAFIPMHALPYLQYMADPAYCHVTSVDMTPLVFDASINGGADDQKIQNATCNATNTCSWRTIVIGGMRFGGACKDANNTCTNCVKTPIPGVGYSSYFALDVTNPNSPQLLWEFSNPDLGFSSSGPAIIRIDGLTGGAPDKKTNGNWFVVFGSGPTGPISTSDHQFLGTSDQELQLFIVDLRTGNLLRTVHTNIFNAFAGSLAGGGLDLDNDYQDDLLYIPYVKKDEATNTWTKGGVGRLRTNKSATVGAWDWNKLIDNTGPVTAAVAKADDETAGNLWVYFGTGRYYYVQNTRADDPTGQRYIFGIKDPCRAAIANNSTCSASDPVYDFSTPFTTGLRDVTNVNNAPTQNEADASSFKGWYIALDPDGLYTYPPDPPTDFLAERAVNDPTVSLSSQVVYFSTYKPYTDMCLLGGKSFLWAMKYNTGGTPTGLTGMVLVQSSTGAIQQMNLKDIFGDPNGPSGGRKSNTAIEGMLAGNPTTQAKAKPVKRFIHIKER